MSYDKAKPEQLVLLRPCSHRPMIEKYGFDRMEALRRFVSSETHELLENPENGLSSFGCNGIFDIWECEVITGDPRNSIYIRGE